jgi:hypothetical protein
MENLSNKIYKNSEYNQWVQYEIEKKRLKNMNLHPKGYSEQIKKLCERLEI